MEKTLNIKVISLDIFRTLVSIDVRHDSILKSIFGKELSAPLSEAYSQRINQIITSKFIEAGGNDKSFKNERTLFEETYSVFFKENGLDYSARLAADALIKMHTSYSLYPDARLFLERLGNKYPVCLSSDCDIEMIPGIEDIYPFDYIFTSEEIKAYKQHPRFFKYVIDHYQLNPENILHIGDSIADILIPRQFGLVTCWINRFSQKWRHAVCADFEINSLAEALDFPGLL